MQKDSFLNLRAPPASTLVSRLIASLANDRSCHRIIQQRDLVIDQDETVRDLNRATGNLPVSRLRSSRWLGLTASRHVYWYWSSHSFFQTFIASRPRIADPIVHHGVCGKAIR